MSLVTRDLLLDRGPSALGDRSLHNDVYAAIIDWIHQGELRPGDRLSEAAIASRLGISRGPVREAISRLDHEGILIRQPRRGPIVPSFSQEDLEELNAVRQLIEGRAARIVSQRLTSQGVEELEGLIDAMRITAQAGQRTETSLLNARFHAAVIRLSGTRFLNRIWQTLHPLAWLLSVGPPNKSQSSESLVLRHRELVDALMAGDPDRAEAAFREHVDKTYQATRLQLALQMDQDGPAQSDTR